MRLLALALMLSACGPSLEAHVWDCSVEVRCAGTQRAYVMNIRSGSYCTVTSREAQTQAQEVCSQYLTGTCGECVPRCVESEDMCLP